MINKEILKKQIIYRSSHRGTKEMDLLLEKEQGSCFLRKWKWQKSVVLQFLQKS